MRRECRERFPLHRLQRKSLTSDPGMHHGTCVTHVPWCMSGSLTHGGEENVPSIPGACATHNFAYLVRGPDWPNAQHVDIGLGIGLGNGLLLHGTKPLTEPKLTRDNWHPSQCIYPGTMVYVKQTEWDKHSVIWCSIISTHRGLATSNGDIEIWVNIGSSNRNYRVAPSQWPNQSRPIIGIQPSASTREQWVKALKK